RFEAGDGIRGLSVSVVHTFALPISAASNSGIRLDNGNVMICGSTSRSYLNRMAPVSWVTPTSCHERLANKLSSVLMYTLVSTNRSEERRVGEGGSLG